MSNENLKRSIQIYLKEADEPLWVVTDSAEPAPGDEISIEQADGSVKSYKVLNRVWLTAKQGESSFSGLRLVVKEIVAPQAMMFIAASGKQTRG